MEELAQQHTEIDRLNKIHRSRFRLLKGIEANIRADGSVDMTDEEIAAARNRRRGAPFDAAIEGRPDGANAESGRHDRGAHPRAPARPHVRVAPGRFRRLGQGVREGGEEPASRLRSTVTRRGRTSTSNWRAARFRPGACSRSTATRIRRPNCSTRTPRSRMPGSPGFPRSASSTAGRSIDC